jgi:hypothetical protein
VVVGRGEERNKIKRKGNEGGLRGEKNFGGLLSRHFWKGHAMSIFFKGVFFLVGVARDPQPSTQVRPLIPFSFLSNQTEHKTCLPETLSPQHEQTGAASQGASSSKRTVSLNCPSPLP